MHESNRVALQDLLTDLAVEMGFMDEDQLGELARLDPRRLVVVRYSQGRETVHAGRAVERIAYAERLYGWSIRDVSLLSTDEAFTGHCASQPPAMHFGRVTSYIRPWMPSARRAS